MLDLRFGRAATLVALAMAAALPAGAQETEERRSERERAEQERAERLHERAEEMRERASRIFINGRDMSLYANRGRIGVSITSSSDDEDYAGALITEVTPDGPAEQAGIREGDVITAINGHSLMEPLPDRSDERDLDLDGAVTVQRLMALMKDTEPGDDVEVTYERDGVETTTTVVAESLGNTFVFGSGGSGNWSVAPDVGFDFHDLENMRIEVAPQVARIRDWAGAWGFSGFGSSGLELAALNPDLGSYFGAEEGVLVLDIDEDTTLGLEPGDVLLDIDGREVRDRDHARRILGSYEPGETVSFGIIRKGSNLQVDGHMPERRRRSLRDGGLRN